MNIRKAHCFYEQSGTFKNEFIKLGIPAEDYDIQNEFKQTDHVIDLFKETDKAYDGKPSVFDGISKDDLIMAFFPCIYFEAIQQCYYNGSSNNLRNRSEHEKTDIILERVKRRQEFVSQLYKLVSVVKSGGQKLVIENPAVQPHYLLFPTNFYAPTFIDKDRTRRGDAFKKPTAYWFFNCEPTKGRRSYCKPKETKTVFASKSGAQAGVCSMERSMISPVYARNFICDFILGRDNEYTERRLFDD